MVKEIKVGRETAILVVTESRLFLKVSHKDIPCALADRLNQFPEVKVMSIEMQPDGRYEIMALHSATDCGLVGMVLESMSAVYRADVTLCNVRVDGILQNR